MTEQGSTIDRKRYPILFVDDEPEIIETFQLSFDEEFRVLGTTKPSEALELIERHEVDVLVTDQRMPEMSGVELIARARERRSTLVPIIVTGYTDLDTLVSAINLRGVYRYIPKPWDPDDVRETIQSAIETVHLAAENRRLTSENVRLVDELRVANQLLAHENRHLRRREGGRDAFRAIVGGSAALQRTIATAARASDSKVIVLLQGPTGTGKELFARALHEASPRHDKPFVTVDCTLLTEDRLQSELFGHKRGAFTGATEDRVGAFELAHEGTVFLDEIGELAVGLQPKLLRVLQEGEIVRMGETMPRKVDVRLVAATNRDLAEEERAGRFRSDLRFRLSEFPIQIPSLADRSDDIPALVRFFLQKYGRAHGRNVAEVDPAAMAVLMGGDYPGNVRELENVISRALVMCDPDDAVLTKAHLAGLVGHDGAPADDDASLEAQVGRFERQVILQALRRHDHNRTRTAEALGITRRWLHKKLDQHDLRDLQSDD